jgi:dienelactone hydrolase
LIAIAVWVGLTAARALAADPRADFLKLIDRGRVPLDAKQEADASVADGSQIRFSFAAEADQRVPGILIKPAGATGRRPVVIVLHGTGGTAQGMLPLMKKFVARGMTAVAIDGRHHGARTPAGKGSAAYNDAIVKAWKNPGSAHPFFFDTVWDVMRLVDYLQTRDDIDASHIGLIGISKGGIETYLSAAVDPRIAAAVPCIGVQSFAWALDNDKWQPRIGTIKPAFDAIAKLAGVEKPDTAFVRAFYAKVSPGIDGEFDAPSMLPLIAPRPLMTINGEIDDRTPPPGLKLCTDAALQAYRAAGAEDRLKVVIEPRTGHKVTSESEIMAVDFLAQWLGVDPTTRPGAL